MTTDILSPFVRTADIIDPPVDPYADDPSGWTTERLKEPYGLWSMQRMVMESVRDYRYTAVPSSFDTGKSFTASRLAGWWIDTHPLGEAFVVTTAPTWAQVKAILWREIRRAHSRGNLPGRTTLDAQWYAGGVKMGDAEEELVAFGRKPADYDPAAFQGIHAKYVLVLIDEAAGVPQLLYDAVDGLAANRYSRVLAIGNPDDPVSHFATICRPGSGWNVIRISAFDTPAFTDEEVDEGLLDLLVSPEWVEERKKRWGESSPMYISKVLGEFPDIGEDTLIEPRLIREAEARDLSGRARVGGVYGWDIARYGSDKTVGYRNRGGMIRKVYVGEKQSTMETAGHIMRICEPHKGKAATVVDADGLGGGVYDRLQEQRLRNLHPFHGGERAYEPDRFVNRRSEVYWNLRTDMEDGQIDLPPAGEGEDLKAQLGAIKWGVDSKGRIAVETKKEMKKRGLPSPDEADAAVYATVPEGTALPAALRSPTNGTGSSITGDLLTKEM